MSEKKEKKQMLETLSAEVEAIIKEEKKEKKKEKKTKKQEEQEKLQRMYDMVMSYENRIHEQNQKRIKIGLKCIYIIPAIFLFLMFMTGSSKVIFLVLWIVSLFGIAIYLIGVEYVDYNLQQKMNVINGEDDAEPEALIDLPEPVEEKIIQVTEKLENRGGEA